MMIHKDSVSGAMNAGKPAALQSAALANALLTRLSGRGKHEDKIRSPGLMAGALMAGNGSGGAIGYRASAFGLQE
jgi:hypothetical protein